jgi:drug/metabolite transporter (DMT)-like permease
MRAESDEIRPEPVLTPPVPLQVLSGWTWWVAAGYALVVVIWGTTWFTIQTQINGTSPHVAVALRMGAASLIFFGIAAVSGLSLKLTYKQARMVLIQGFCYFGLNYVAVYEGSQYLTSGVVAVIFSVSVPFNILAEWLIMNARPRIVDLAAAFIGMCGVAVVFSTEIAHALSADGALSGAGLVVFSAIIVAVGNVLATRIVSTEMNAVRLNAFGMAAGTAVILAWGLVSGAPWILELTTPWLTGYAYLVLIGSVLAFGIYMKILPTIGSVAGAYVVVLSPIVAILISSVLEGLTLGGRLLTGVLLLLVGNSLLIIYRRRP